MSCCRFYRAAINKFFDLGYFLAYAARIVPAEFNALKGGLQNAHVYCFDRFLVHQSSCERKG
jgi:hypothetical protein